ncbi:FBD-like protein [Artemisia annua]|uniref:FBD-like protein n=1 Tax=Artemisia annua TaxID=35608 RepID=A0A2U1L5I3_ARTAN|nr:FBD-like protein [Artemisia annua]
MGSKDVDRLSNMPDEVLSEILSLMPTKLAVRTSILSKRWRYNWTLVTSIDIDVLPFHGVENCCAFVDRVLDLCKSTEIKLFRLRFSNLWVQESRMTKWINEALRRKVSEFEIQCGLLELPISFYTCKTLTKLRVENECQEVFMDWQTPFNLPCLKTLDIALFSKPSLNAYKLIRGCPILESLSLQFTYDPDEEEYIFSIPTLKRLTLVKKLKWGPCNKLVFIVPNLEELCLDSRWCLPFRMEELPSLVSELSDAPLRKAVNIKHLELKSDLSLCWVSVFQYLENCSQLEHLTIEKPGESESESDWIEPHTVPTCMLMNLKTIKFESCMVETDDIQFLEYMLGNAEVLKRITITCKSGLMEEELQLCARLLKCPRASKYCGINFVGKSFYSATNKFVMTTMPIICSPIILWPFDLNGIQMNCY